MRYAIQRYSSLLFTCLFLTPVWAQNAAPLAKSADVPGVLPASNAVPVTSWDSGNAAESLPQADNRGSVSGSSVAERMRAIRRRAVDSNIGRPFLATDGEGFETDAPDLSGALPAVKRRPLGPIPGVDTTPVAEPSVSESTRRLAEPAAEPTPAMELAEMPPNEPAPADPEPMEFRPMPTVTPTPSSNGGFSSQDNDKDVLLTNEAPAISFRTSGPRRISIGREAAYQVTIFNHSSSTADEVICTVQLPPWADVTGTSSSIGAPNVDVDERENNIVRWVIPHLQGNGRETLALNIVPRDSRPFDLAIGWALGHDQSMAQIEVEEPKLELTLNGSEEVDYGDTQKYTISVSNPGSGDAENVMLNLMPMANQQQMAGARNLGTIAAGERKSIELELTAHQAGRLTVKAMAFAEGGLRAEASQDVLVRRANLDVVIMGPPRNYAATVATYKIRIENTGNSMADNAVAVVSLPAGATFVDSTDGGKFDAQRAQVQWNIGALRPSSIRVLEMKCELNSAGENRVDVQCQSSQEINVAKSVVTVVEALADLKLFVNDPPGAVSVGQESEYEVRIANRGTKAAENIQLIGYFSEGVEPESVVGGPAQLSTGQVMFDPIDYIAPGKEVVYRISARASQPGNHVFRAELKCRSPETRLATEEWTKFYQGEGEAEHVQAARRVELR